MTQTERNKLIKALYGMMGRKADEDVLAGWTLALHGKQVEMEDLRAWCQEVGAEGWRGWAPEPSEFLSWLRGRKQFGVHPDSVLDDQYKVKLRRSRERRGLGPDERDPVFLASLPKRFRDAIEAVGRGAKTVPNPLLGKNGELEFDPFERP